MSQRVVALVGLFFVLSVVFTSSVQQYKVAFGSCSALTNTEDTSIFQNIANTNPDAFIWLGDVTYLDRIDFKDTFSKYRLDDS
jgi:phosphodiesterase/alkaline phosphatase D-like protein